MSHDLTEIVGTNQQRMKISSQKRLFCLFTSTILQVNELNKHKVDNLRQQTAKRKQSGSEFGTCQLLEMNTCKFFSLIASQKQS